MIQDVGSRKRHITIHICLCIMLTGIIRVSSSIAELKTAPLNQHNSGVSQTSALHYMYNASATRSPEQQACDWHLDTVRQPCDVFVDNNSNTHRRYQLDAYLSSAIIVGLRTSETFTETSPYISRPPKHVDPSTWSKWPPTKLLIYQPVPCGNANAEIFQGPEADRWQINL